MLRAAFRRGRFVPVRSDVQHNGEPMKIRPLYDRVVVSRIAEEEKTKGGIIIPDTAKEKPVEGKVLAVGSGRTLEDGTLRKLDINVGDRVLFGKYSGTEVKIGGEDHLILREEDILGVVEK
jgi:chaperonin GroES